MYMFKNLHVKMHNGERVVLDVEYLITHDNDVRITKLVNNGSVLDERDLLDVEYNMIAEKIANAVGADHNGY
jgi:hypothetical protein